MAILSGVLAVVCVGRIFKQTECMKAKNRIELAPGVAALCNLTARTAVASLVLATATIPAMAGNGPRTVIQEGPNAIRPFHINVPEEALVNLRQRIAATRWPDKETVSDRSQGMQLEKIQELARYWATDYDWRKCEAATVRDYN